ncbi:MAG: hypothetical protein WEA10_01465 [Actinomycetota bacterium]
MTVVGPSPIAGALLAHAGGADEVVSTAIVFVALWVGWVGWSRLRKRGFHRLPSGAAWALVVGAPALVVVALTVPRAVLDTPSIDLANRPASTASLGIDEPTMQERVLQGAPIPVRLDLRGGRVVQESSSAITPDEGHIHLTLDGRLLSMTYGPNAPLELPGDLDTGEHLLEVEFVATDHFPFDPRVRAETSFEVTA